MEGVQIGYIENKAPSVGTGTNNNTNTSGEKSPFSEIFQTSSQSTPAPDDGKRLPENGNPSPQARSSDENSNKHGNTSAEGQSLNTEQAEAPRTQATTTESSKQTTAPEQKTETSPELNQALQPPTPGLGNTPVATVPKTQVLAEAGERSENPAATTAAKTKVLAEARERSKNPTTSIDSEKTHIPATKTTATDTDAPTNHADDPSSSIGILELNDLHSSAPARQDTPTLTTLESAMRKEKTVSPAALSGLKPNTLEQVEANATRSMPPSLRTLAQLKQGQTDTPTPAIPPQVTQKKSKNLVAEKQLEQAAVVAGQNNPRTVTAADKFAIEWANAKPVSELMGAFKSTAGMPPVISDIHTPTLSQTSSYAGIETGLKQFDITSRTMPGQVTATQGLPSPTLNMGQQGWEQSFGKNIAWMINNGNQSAQIKISPAELGLVQINVNMNQDQLSLQINAQQPATRDALEASLPRLRELLGDSGFGSVNVDVSSQQQGNQNANEENNDLPIFVSENQSDLDDEAISSPLQRGDSLRMLDTFA